MSDKTFTASNGYEIAEDGGELDVYSKYGGFYTTISEPLSEALHEYSQHLRDQQLGRARWPEDPDYVIYRDTEHDDDDGRCVRVLHEPSGLTGKLWERLVRQHIGTIDAAAHWYFTEGPGKKPERPWEEAQPGEVWRLTHYGEERNAVAEKDDSSDRVWFNTHDNYISAADTGVTAGRKLVNADGTPTEGHQA